MNYAVKVLVAETEVPEDIESCLENSLCLDRELNDVKYRSELSPITPGGETCLEGDYHIKMCEEGLEDDEETGYEDGLRINTIIQELADGVFREFDRDDRLVIFYHRCVHDPDEPTVGQCSWRLGWNSDDWSAFPDEIRRRWGSYRPE